jgi:Uma2 family endonuclease
MSVRNPIPVTDVEYPETDGRPMAETDAHRRLMTDLIFILENFFQDQPDVYVSGNLLLYYVEGDPKKRVAPDVFVVRGVGKGPRRIYKLWAEGRAPEAVIELSSRQTWRDDLQVKWQLYAQLGVPEYFIFEPEYDYLDEPLIGYRLEEGQYQPLEVKDGRVRSEALGLELVDTGETLRLWDPQAGQFLLTPAEAAAEVARLRAELKRLGPPSSSTENPGD